VYWSIHSGGGGGGGGGDGRDTATVLVQVPEKGAPPGVLLSVALPGTGMSAMVPVPPGAEPGSVVEVTVCFAGVRESEVLAKMARLRKEAEKKIQRETEQVKQWLNVGEGRGRWLSARGGSGALAVVVSDGGKRYAAKDLQGGQSP